MCRNNWLRIFADTLLAIALVVSCGPAFAGEFKATVSDRFSENPESFPISVKGSKSRLDRTLAGRQTVILIDQERSILQVLDVAERKYAQRPLVSFEAAVLHSLPSIIGMTAALPGVETKPLGTETVGGYSCEKFAIVKNDPTLVLLTYWVSQKLAYPLKIAYDPKGEKVFEVTNIQEGPVEESVFQVPSAYTLAETPGPPMPDWGGDVPAAPVVKPRHQQRMSAGEIIRVKVEANKKIEVSGEGETENQEDATFTAVGFRGGKPTQDPSYTTSTASKGSISTFGFDNTPEEAEEIVVRVNKGVVLIGVKQCGVETLDEHGHCPDLADLPDAPDFPAWVREVPNAPVVKPPHQQHMSAGEIIRVKVEAGKQIEVAGKGETENPEDANFNLVPFSGGKPVEVPGIFLPPGSEPYPTYPAFVGPVDQLGPVHHLRGKSQMEEGADEIVVRVNKGVVFIEVKQCGFETVVRRYCPGWPD